MSRPSNYEFVSANPEVIEQDITTMYTALTGKEPRASSPEKLFIQWIVSIIVQAYARINIAGNQNIPSRATGANLDALGELYFDSTRPEAQAATVTMRFTLSAAQASVVVIPAGTRVSASNGSIVFATEEEAHIPIGDTTVDVMCVCEETGTIGNGIEAGNIVTCVAPFPYYSSCVNIDESEGGADAATDDEYYELMVASEDAYSVAGARGAYEYWAKSVSTEIEDVLVTSPNPGEVNLTYYVSQESEASMTDVTNAVNAAVEEYIVWQTSKIGRDLNPSKLIQMVVEAGAKRVVVTSPVYTHLEDGSDGSHATPQLARIGTKTVTNGGYEDE